MEINEPLEKMISESNIANKRILGGKNHVKMNYWGKNNSTTTKSLQKSYMKINESLKKY